MDRTTESTAQSRETLARRLELSALRIEDARVVGEVGGFEVALPGDAPFRECHVTLGGALPLSLLRLEHGDLNHADAVETGDPEFDEAMQVLALPGHAPTLEQVLRPREVRAQVLALLRRFPDSLVRGNVLVIKTSEGVTHETILEAVELAKVLSKQFAQVGFVTTEAPPAAPRAAFSKGFKAAAGLSAVALPAWWWFASSNGLDSTLVVAGSFLAVAGVFFPVWLTSDAR